MKRADARLLTAFFLAAAALPAQYKTPNPQVAKVVSDVSDEKIAEILKKLESFGTRNILSTLDNPTRGVGAARKWIYEQFRSYSPKLEVRFDQYKLKKIEGRAARVPRDVDLYNVVAVLPGTTNKEQRIIVSGHYDTLVMSRPTGAPTTPGEAPPMRDPDLDAPGVTDDGSGTACVMELARVLSTSLRKRWSSSPSRAKKKDCWAARSTRRKRAPRIRRSRRCSTTTSSGATSPAPAAWKTAESASSAKTPTTRLRANWLAI
jgi:hypothetical protein